VIFAPHPLHAGADAALQSRHTNLLPEVTKEPDIGLLHCEQVKQAEWYV
jgi:hypothetical protein